MKKWNLLWCEGGRSLEHMPEMWYVVCWVVGYQQLMWKTLGETHNKGDMDHHEANIYIYIHEILSWLVMQYVVQLESYNMHMY